MYKNATSGEFSPKKGECRGSKGRAELYIKNTIQDPKKCIIRTNMKPYEVKQNQKKGEKRTKPIIRANKVKYLS